MRSALRSLWRRPAFAAAGILTIALGVGANTALFGVVYSVLIRPLPFRDPNMLVQIWETHPALPQLQVTAPDFRDWRDQARSFEQLAAYTLSSMNTATLLGRGEPEVIHATMASSSLFPTMGIRPSIGRAFDDAEERSNQRVALISENLWRRKFGGDPAIVGQQIRLQTESFRVIGVVAQRQSFPEWADLWMPLSLMESELQTRRKYHPLEVVGRVKRGMSLAQAQSEIQTLARRLAEAHPETNATVGAYVIPLSRELTQKVRPSLLLAWGAVGLVLLIACANLAHLFLARMIERRQEMAVREALGAKTWHLIRELLSESLLIVAIGGVVGVLLAVPAVQLVGKLAANQIPRFESSRFEGPVWLFAIGASAIAGVLFGLPACWQLLRRRVQLTGRSIAPGKSRLSAVLMAGEVAMALLVLSGTALLTRNFAALLNEDPGFEARNVWVVPNLPLQNNWDKAADFLGAQLEPPLRNLPGVTAVAAVNSAPMSLGLTEHSRFATRFGIEGRIFDSGNFPVAQSRWSTPEYFRVLGIPLKAGRWLSEDDRGKPRILVNETLVRRFFPMQGAVGKRLVVGVMDQKQDFDEIVGVVGDVRDLGLDQDVEPTMYGIATGPVMTLLVKTSDDSKQFALALRNSIQSVDPEIPVPRVQPLQQNVSDSLARRRFALILLGVFGAMAAFLTAGGIYGLLMQSVNGRVREFGVRAAVGAVPGELVSMMLREALMLTAPGLILGVMLAFWFTSMMKAVVYQLSPADPVSITAALVFVVLLTLFSAWLPARRAANVDPASALRAE